MNPMGAQEFVRRLKNLMDDSDNKLVFFLGAGCSVSSGIPDAGTLVHNWLPRLKKLKTGTELNLEEWVKQEFPDYNNQKSSRFYERVIEALFLTPEERQKEIERLFEGKDPGFGYAILARLMSHQLYGRHCNIVLTTNFDDMIADALYLYSNKKPLVVFHESLINFVRISRTRPLVIKLHGDVRIAPKHTEIETSSLDEAVKRILKKLLSETGLIFVGYGGNDRSILNILGELPPEALPLGVYWVSNQVPNSKMGKWLEERRAVWVNHLDFDELMLLIQNEFDLRHPEKERFERLLETYFGTFQKLRNKVEAKPDTAERRLLETAVEKAVQEFSSWWSVILEASKYKTKNTEKACHIYRQGLQKFPCNAGLLAGYANFLEEVIEDYDQAEEYYLKAIAADGNSSTYLLNYAGFLKEVRRDYEKAAEYYARAEKDFNSVFEK